MPERYILWSTPPFGLMARLARVIGRACLETSGAAKGIKALTSLESKRPRIIRPGAAFV